jgi:hypothetical protein|nr:hypothetical protein [uncultured Acetatifactor sp.]
MDTNTVRAFVNKAVERTKCSELTWISLPDCFDLKPVSETFLNTGIDESSGYKLIPFYSYYSKYKSGFILLLLFTDDVTLTTPPDNCIISLRVQDDTSKLAVEISNNQFDPVDDSLLIRLYNLVDSNRMSSVRSLINDFLDR